MKQTRKIFVAIAIIVATVLSFVSCDDKLELIKFVETLYIKGDSVHIDTEGFEKIICYDFNKKGNIEGHLINHAGIREFPYNPKMEASQDIFFETAQEEGKAIFSASKKVYFNENSIAYLPVSNGVDTISVPIKVIGAYSLMFDDEEIFPCKPLKTVSEEVKKESELKIINEKKYEVASVPAILLNGKDEEVEPSQVTLYLHSPIKEVNERTVELSYKVVEKDLVVTGNIGNTVEPDSTIVLKVPLDLTFNCEAKKTVNGQNSDFAVNGNPALSSTKTVKSLSKKDGNLTVAYDEYEDTYSHKVKASGSDVELKQTVKYYNKFVATLYGEKLEIDLPASVGFSDYQKVNETATTSATSYLYNVNYTASQSSLTASAKQEVEIVVAKTNERNVTITYKVGNGEVVVTGKVDNTVDEDETFTVNVPQILSVNTESKKTVNGQNSDFAVNGNPALSSTKTVKSLSKKDGNLTVAYDEYEDTYSHKVKASGSDVELKQTVKYYNKFVATLYGEKLEIDLPASVGFSDYQKVNETATTSATSYLYNVNYTASQSSLTASAKQEVEIVVAKTSFDGETVLYANRTVTFDKLQSPKVYDCVVTSVLSGGNNYHYREVFADGSKGAWKSEALSSADFEFISKGMKNANAALAIYNHKNVDGSRVGYLRDFLSDAGQVIYFANNCPQSTFDKVNSTMFGQLDACVLGAAKEVDGVMVMSCIAGNYNNATISPAETIYLY